MKKTRGLFWPITLALSLASSVFAQPGIINNSALGNTSYSVVVNAVPDDGVDDTATVQAAINLVHARNGGKVIFTRPGTYNYTGIFCTGGAQPTAPNTTLNSALVTYDNVLIESVPGVIHKLGLVKDDSKCYLLRNANPTNGNSNIVIDGGVWDGGGIITECTAPTSTTFSFPGNYAARLGAGVVFNVSNAAGKTAFTAVSAAYSAPNTTVTITALDTGRSLVGVTTGAAGTGFFQVASSDVTALYPAGSTITIAGNADSSTNGSYTISSSIYNVSGDTKTRVYVTTTIPAGATVSGTASCGAKAGGFQSSWQAAVTLQPTVTSIVTGTKTITLAVGDYTVAPYNIAPGSTFYIYGNTAAAANVLTPYTVATISNVGVVTTVEAITGTPNNNGNVAFVFPRLWYQDGLYFNNVTGLQIKNAKFQGWDKYATWFVNCNRFVFSDNEFNNGSDGFHISGLCKNGVVRNTRGRCLDNMIPMVSNELWYRPALYATTLGTISNILVDGFFCDSSIGTCLEPVRLTGKYVSTGDPCSINEITIRGGRGTVGSGNAIRLGDDLATGYGLLAGTLMNRILVSDISMVVPNGYAVVDISGSGVKTVTVQNVRISGTKNKAVYVHSPTGAASGTILDALTIDGLTTVASFEKLIHVDGIVTYFTLSNSLLMTDGVTGTTEDNGSTGSAHPQGQGVFVNTGLSAAEGQIYHGCITNCNFDARATTNGTGPLVNLAQTSLLTQLDISNTNFRQSTGVGCTFFQVSGPANMAMNNVFVNGDAVGATYLNLNNTAARLRLSGSGVRVSKAKNALASGYASALHFTDAAAIGGFLTAVTGNATMNCTIADLPIDMTAAAFTTAMMTNGAVAAIPVSGDTFFNDKLYSTGTTGSPGAGRMVFNADNGALGGTIPGYWEMAGTPTPQVVAGSITVSPYHSKMTYNVTATATLTLPPALVGMSFTILNNGSGTVTITADGSGTADGIQQVDGNGSHVINDSVPNTYIASIVNNVQGSRVTLKCMVADKWEIVSSRGVWDADGN